MAMAMIILREALTCLKECFLNTRLAIFNITMMTISSVMMAAARLSRGYSGLQGCDWVCTEGKLPGERWLHCAGRAGLLSSHPPSHPAGPLTPTAPTPLICKNNIYTVMLIQRRMLPSQLQWWCYLQSDTKYVMHGLGTSDWRLSSIWVMRKWWECPSWRYIRDLIHFREAHGSMV